MSPIRILLQTTIPAIADDWHIGRFALLQQYLSALTDEAGQPLCTVVARDRAPTADGPDPVLSQLEQSEFDELWLFAVDSGNGLSDRDCAGIHAFRTRGGGVLITRDHMDLGCSVCALPQIGSAHFFHTHNPDPDPTRHCIDDPYTTAILWPNYHSGRNGDCQVITPVAPLHPLLKNPANPTGHITYLPAHPHEGAVGVPNGVSTAQVIATGTSQTTQRAFNLAVAFERDRTAEGYTLGRAVAESTFHHFCDYNWDATLPCPSFVDEPPGTTMQTEPQALPDLKAYVRNLALWLAGRL